MKKFVSIIVPVYNEEQNLLLLHAQLQQVLKTMPLSYEIIYVNDGSEDASGQIIERLSRKNPTVTYLEFSRNFGKELATTAGLHICKGDAALLIDADLQHPVTLIPEFLSKWEQGAEVVVGIRNRSKSDGFVKRAGSFWFYKIMNTIAETKLIPQATDFRLLDRIVIDEFNRLTERTRITRGLIDWLGFRREYIFFHAHERANGKASYSTLKLFKLASASFITLSLFPLRLAGYIGAIIMAASGSLGIVMFTDRYLAEGWLNFSGPAILANLILFLVGIVLVSLGILAFYIGTIHQEVQNRPLYVIRKSKCKIQN